MWLEWVLPLQMMFSTITGSGAKGRPMKSWNDHVRDALAAIGQTCDWWRKCKDREQLLKATIQMLLNVPSP